MCFNDLWSGIDRFNLSQFSKERYLPSINYEFDVDEESQPTQMDIVNTKVENAQMRLHILNRKLNILMGFTNISNILTSISCGLFSGGICIIFGGSLRISIGVALGAGFIGFVITSKKWSQCLKEEYEIQNKLKRVKPEQLEPSEENIHLQ